MEAPFLPFLMFSLSHRLLLQWTSTAWARVPRAPCVQQFCGVGAVRSGVIHLWLESAVPGTGRSRTPRTQGTPEVLPQSNPSVCSWCSSYFLLILGKYCKSFTCPYENLGTLNCTAFNGYRHTFTLRRLRLYQGMKQPRGHLLFRRRGAFYSAGVLTPMLTDARPREWFEAPQTPLQCVMVQVVTLALKRFRSGRQAEVLAQSGVEFSQANPWDRLSTVVCSISLVEMKERNSACQHFPKQNQLWVYWNVPSLHFHCIRQVGFAAWEEKCLAWCGLRNLGHLFSGNGSFLPLPISSAFITSGTWP